MMIGRADRLSRWGRPQRRLCVPSTGRARDIPPSEAPQVGEAVARLVAVAEQGYTWRLAPQQFGEALATRVVAEPDLHASLDRVHAADLYLATGCAHQVGDALAAFEASYGAEIDLAIRKSSASRTNADDLRQRIWQKLFVGTSAAAPAIARYSGSGKLRSWVRMTAVRALIDHGRVLGPQRELPADEMVIETLLEPERDPELEYLKNHYRAEFKSCVARALEDLDARQRSVLKYSFADRLPIDDIGRIYGVHRATAARWLTKARDALIVAVRAELERRFTVSGPEFESILRLVRSRIEIDFGGRRPRREHLRRRHAHCTRTASRGGALPLIPQYSTPFVCVGTTAMQNGSLL